jgi:type III secretion protein O
MKVFDELLAIKRFREGQAELAVARQRQLHAEAERQRDTAREQLAEYKIWAQRQEDELYEDLCSRVVRVSEIEDVLDGVTELREGERERETRVETAVEQVNTEAEALVQRRLVHRTATRMVEKFVELARVHLVEYLHEVERKEDLEMEEAASISRDRNDWEEHEEYEPS